MFWDQVRADGECWVWTGHRTARGYGWVSGYHFTEGYAHRLSWTMAVGPIPGGLWVLHHCDNPPCVNPDHLYVGTPSDNAQDRERRGRGNHPMGKIGPRPDLWRTHCIRGHEFTEANTIRFRSDGAKRCRTCTRARQRARRQASKAA